jgi:uncharacterized membrane protein YccC
VANIEALKSAARAAIVMPSVFAFADQLIGNPQTSLFAAFGSFAVLVLVEFGGGRRMRLVAYLAFAAVGVVLITLGTLCSRDAWLAAGATGVVGFLTLFSGAFNGYFAAASTGAILLFVLPANIPAPNSAIPDRLLGFALAAGVGTAASLFLWPPRRRADLRRSVAGAMRSVVELIEADPAQAGASADAARAAVEGLRRSFLGSQHRPAGPTNETAALVALPDELDWLLSFLEPPLEMASVEDAEAMASAAAVLRASIDRLEGGSAQADFDRLERARVDVAHAVIRQLPELPPRADAAVLPETLETPFRVRAATYSARQVGLYAMRATAGNVPSDEETDVAAATSAVDAAEQLALEHASMRSVWLRNSIRGAVALAVSVFIAQRLSLQHGFWVVLGTLSVLRSNALATGWSIVSALAGTAVGIVVGALLVIAIGTHHAVLWAVLPIAVLLAAYAPRAISFAAGQAGFTITLLVLFNIIQPVGWQVGVVRVEDVAIGFAVSFGVGLLFWPRGAAALLRSNLANAFARGADYVTATMRELAVGGDAGETTRAAHAADATAHHLDDVFRQYLVERSATRFNVEDVAALVGGAERLRRTALSLVALESMLDGSARLDHCGAHIEDELNTLHAWYVSFGDALVNQRTAPPPHLRDRKGRRELFECVRAAASSGDKASKRAALILLLAVQHLENLRRLEAHLAERANVARHTDSALGARDRTDARKGEVSARVD